MQSRSMVDISLSYWMLGCVQVLHSMEETTTKLYLDLDSMIETLHKLFLWFPLVEISANTFAVFNYLMIALMLGSVPAAAQGKRIGIVLMWSWAVIEMLNGAFHIGTWMFLQTYFPGGISGPILFVLSILFIQQLRVSFKSVTQAVQ